MPSEAFVAHSSSDGGDPQLYRDHLFGEFGVVNLAESFARQAARYHPRLAEVLTVLLANTGEFHDLGKLLSENQQVLRGDSGTRLPLDHVDAGVVHLKNSGSLEAAVLVYCHHRGLCDFASERVDEKNAFRFKSTTDAEAAAGFRRRLETEINELLRNHSEATQRQIEKNVTPPSLLSTFDWRVALSCLVDADHTNTAMFYGQLVPLEVPSLRAAERLKALENYVEGLGSSPFNSQHGKNDQNAIRKEFFEHCLKWSTDAKLIECDASVGSGKTTSVVAHLLKVAFERVLDRIIVVLPYTNIIDQTVEVLRKALVLEGEVPEAVVMAHHHRTEFSDPNLRGYSTTWNAPVVVTTSVQFFEALSGASTSTLRKLHRVCNSAIMIDEAHCAIPIQLWRPYWHWMQELADNWGSHFVFSSGSLTRIWSIEKAVAQARNLPSLLPSELRSKMLVSDHKRVVYNSHPDPLTLSSLCDWISSEPGPRIVVMNTVQGAAAVAKRLAELHGRERVMHLSTALCPKHRKPIIDIVKRRLMNHDRRDWFLVATSCVEAGINFSFQTGFRERSTPMSFAQLAGRVDRDFDWEVDSAVVWDFWVDDPKNINTHPEFKQAALLMKEFAAEQKLGPEHCSEFVAVMLQRYQDSLVEEGKKIMRDEDSRKFPQVEEQSRLIKTNSKTVLIDREVYECVKRRERVSYREIQDNSVQMFLTGKKIVELGLELIFPHSSDELYFWKLKYSEDFIGYMEGVLSLKAFSECAFEIV